MGFSIRIVPEPIRQAAFGSITSSYTALGTALAHKARIIAFKNNSDANIYFSQDGIDDHYYLIPGESYPLDITANRVAGYPAYISKDTQFYLKDDGSAATTGTVSLIVLYGLGDQ